MELDVAGSTPGAFHLANGATLNLTYSGTFVVSACYTNGVALNPWVFIPATSPDSSAARATCRWRAMSALASGPVWVRIIIGARAATGMHYAVPVFPIGLTFAGSTPAREQQRSIEHHGEQHHVRCRRWSLRAGRQRHHAGRTIGFNGNPARLLPRPSISIWLGVPAKPSIRRPMPIFSWAVP